MFDKSSTSNIATLLGAIFQILRTKEKITKSPRGRRHTDPNKREGKDSDRNKISLFFSILSLSFLF